MLRFLIPVALSLAGAVQAQSIDERLEQLSPLVEEALSAAKEDGRTLKERIEVLKQTFDLPDSLHTLGADSLQNKDVRELLNLPAAATSEEGVEAPERYAHGVFVLASFSMPGPSLKALLYDASQFGIPVVFRGFVRGSLKDTETLVRALYSETETTAGFSIDPTLFERFDVNAVPVVISLAERIDVCQTQGCVDDPMPAHDRVAGNIPLRAALEIIAGGNGDAPAPAAHILERLTR